MERGLCAFCHAATSHVAGRFKPTVAGAFVLYAFICEDQPDSLALRKQIRPQHLQRLHALIEQGRLLIAGPHPAVDSADPGDAGYSGSLIVAEFDDLASAQAWADQEPYLLGGVYRSVTVKPFVQALP